MSNAGALANLDYDTALDRIASGTLSRTIAEEYGVTARGLRYALIRHRPEEYRQAVKEQAESIVEKAVQYVETCDLETVPIARVRADTAFKYAAARDPDRWGAKSTNITINNNVLAISDSLVGTASDLLGKLRVLGQSELSTVQHERIAQEIGK